jgi:hypothetical protein
MGYEHIDVSRITRLTGELARDGSASLRFVDDFLGAWEQRHTRIVSAVDRMVIDDALAALLSLATSSAMIGADGLSAAARSLYLEARQVGTIPGRGADRLGRIGEAVCAELKSATAAMRAA